MALNRYSHEIIPVPGLNGRIPIEFPKTTDDLMKARGELNTAIFV